MFHATISPNCTHRSIQRSAWVCPNSFHKTCPLKDRAQNGVVCSAVYDSVMLKIVFLHLECYSNAIRRFQIVGLCGHEKTISEETNVSEGASFFAFAKV